MRSSLCAIWPLLLATVASLSGEDDRPPAVIPTRALTRANYADAIAARDRADLMRAAFEQPLRGDAPKERPAATAVIAAYEFVITRYPHTELAAYCVMRLAGFHQFRGKFDDTARLLDEAAEEFAGTPEGVAIAFEAGLHFSQARHDYVRAFKWFASIPVADKLYQSAQEQMAKCEAEVAGNSIRAEQIRAIKLALKEAIPTLTTVQAPPPGDREVALEALRATLSEARLPGVSGEVSRQIASFRDAGHDPVAGLRECYQGESSLHCRTVVVEALREIGTLHALSALKEIALKPGKDGSSQAARAVQAVAALSINQDQISELLSSPSPLAVDEAASALAGKELTDLSVSRLGDLLRSDSARTHSIVARAFGTDPSSSMALTKVQLLMAALPRLDRLTDELPRELRGGYTPRDMAFAAYVAALGEMPGAEDLLRAKLPARRLASVEQEVAALALGLRNDKAGYPLVVRLARESSNGPTRVLAARALGIVGSEKDFELLERLAAEDPFAPPAPHVGDGNVFPVRATAQRSLAELRKRSVPATDGK